ncbi:MAG: hypothetical protein KAH14_06855 [Clostridiales bacterium]|nr:hypothetical protein [Clostridiales bacterium]
MFLKKLDISKKQLIILGVVTLVFITALGIFIGLMSIGSNESYTDLEFLGYQFTASTSKVELQTPLDPQFSVEINDDTIHELETLSSTINSAYVKWVSIIRNTLIFVYLLFFTILIFNKKDTHFQGVFKGFLIGASLLLLLYIVNGIFDLSSLLVSFSHHIGHMIMPG